MGRSMRAYSLISVLTALLIVMVVIFPLLTLQGRLYESAAQKHPDRFIRKVEQDLEFLVQLESRPTSKRWAVDRMEITREIKPMNRYLIQVCYRYGDRTIIAYLHRP